MSKHPDIIIKLNQQKRYINFKVIFAIIFFISGFAYATYNMFIGDKGLISAHNISKNIANKELLLINLRKTRSDLENKIFLLQNNKYNSEYIDELSKKYFIVGRKNEKLIMIIAKKLENAGDSKTTTPHGKNI